MRTLWKVPKLSSWNHLSLRFKLVLSFAGLIVIFMCVGFYNHSTIDEIKAQTTKQEEEANKELRSFQIKQEVESLSLYLAGFLLSKNLGMEEEYLNKVTHLKEGIEWIGSAATASEERKWKAQLDMTLTEYASVFEQAKTIITDPNLTPLEVNGGMERLYQASQLHKEFVFETIDKFIQKFTNDAKLAKADSEELLDSTASISTVVPFIVLILAVAVAYFLIRTFTRPIRELQTAVNRIAAGDLRHTIQSNRKDELGRLSQSFDLMIVQVRDMLSHTRSVASSLSDHSRQFNRFSQETAEANTNIIRAIEEISSGADQQSQYSEASSLIISELEQDIQDIWDSAQSMQNTSEEAERNTMAGTDSVKSLSAAASDTEQRVDQVVQAMHALASSSAQIGKIVQTITEISTQTNVLSLNAAIEAARAGAAGKGFSVIAEEVRVLSQQTNDSSKSISGILNGLLNQISSLESELTEAHRKLLEQNTRVDETLTAFSAIRGSMLDVSTQISSVHNKINGVREKNEQLIQSVQHVAAVAEETAAGVQEVNSSSIQQDASIRHIAGQAEDIDRLAQQLFLQINQFKIDADIKEQQVEEEGNDEDEANEQELVAV